MREILGLHIEEPAFHANDPCQVSAMVVNIDASASGAEARGPAAAPAGSPRVPRLSRPVEERQYVPRLSAPRPSKAATVQPGLARVPTRFSRVARSVAGALVFLAAAFAAYWLLR